MKLYLNDASSASARVRIALALKGLAVETRQVDIFGAEAESRQAAYRDINPQGLVPALLTDGGVLLIQSLAIVEYLDELHPDPPLLPRRIEDRARARAIVLAIAAEIHALVPPRVGLYLAERFAADGEAFGAWNRHWIETGLDAVDRLLAGHRAGCFAVSDTPTIADIFLYPQAVGARRLGFDLSRWPAIAGVIVELDKVAAFTENAPAARR